MHVFIQKLGVMIALLCLTGATAGARTITDARHGFTLTVPARFTTQLPASGMMLYNFATSDPAEGMPDLVASVQRLKGLIGPRQSAMSPTEANEFLQGIMAGTNNTGVATSNITFSTVKWKSYDLQETSAQMDFAGITLLARVVQVPLLHGAVQLVVMAPPDKSAEADTAIAELVDGLTGISNWDPPTSAEYSSDAFMAVPPALILAGLFMKRRKKSSATPSAVSRQRHQRAGRVCWITIAVVAVLFIISGVISFARMKSVYGPERHGFMMVSGAGRLSLWCGILSYGIARLILRMSGKSATPPPMPAPATAGPSGSDFSNLSDGAGAAHNLENIVVENDTDAG